MPDGGYSTRRVQNEKKDLLAMAALTTDGRFKVMVVDERVLYAFDCTVSSSDK